MSGKPSHPHVLVRQLRWLTVLAVAVALLGVSPTRAIDFEKGDFYLSFNNTLSYGLGFRMEDRDEEIIGIANGGTAFSVNGDDGNLNYDTEEVTLRELFQEHGTVSSINIITDRYTGLSKGFGFVEMGSSEEAQAAITALDGREVDGRTLKVRRHAQRFNGPHLTARDQPDEGHPQQAMSHAIDPVCCSWFASGHPRRRV